MIHSLALLSAVLSLSAVQKSNDIVIADFEGPDYGKWTVTGSAFGTGPAHGTLPGQMPVSGFMGKGLVNSFLNGDQSTGTLTSPEFKIERRYIKFLIGGGKDLEKTCMNLIVGGKVVRVATGPNDRPGGSENLHPEAWDVVEFRGKPAKIEIVDRATGGWGHINVDQIVMTDLRQPMTKTNATREMDVTRRFLNIPIKNGATMRKLRFLLDGKVVVENDVELADGAADWWAAVDVTNWKGKKLGIQVDQLPDSSKALDSITNSNTCKGKDRPYTEATRGQFHFSPRRGWTNDPNGLVFYQGQYHMFFQHNPYGWNWGNMHWGHAVSPDMVHWEEQPDALMPDKLGPMFSGSAVVDWNNSSGFGEAGKPAQVLIYTAAGTPSVQCIAHSIDGRNFAKYAGNPVVKMIREGNRDPKVIWHEPTHQWVMAMYLDGSDFELLGSKDLKTWTKICAVELPGSSECPDFFELPVDGNRNNMKWVFTAASSKYAIGSFDGHSFVPETPVLHGHLGQGYYAAQTFSDIPAEDGRRIQVGWFQTATPGMPFNQTMSIPMELKLVSTPDGPRMSWTPIRELQSLRAGTHSLPPAILTPVSDNPLSGVNCELIELHSEFALDSKSEVVFTVRGATIVYDGAKQELIVNGHHAPAPLRDGKQHLTIFCDRMGLEVFADDGLVFVPMPFIPKANDLGLGVKAIGGSVNVSKLEVFELKSAWK